MLLFPLAYAVLGLFCLVDLVWFFLFFCYSFFNPTKKIMLAVLQCCYFLLHTQFLDFFFFFPGFNPTKKIMLFFVLSSKNIKANAIVIP